MADGAQQSVEKRVAELREQLARHNKLYYEQDAPEITDGQYDELINELRALEADHPDLVTDDSPTQKVGGAPAGRFPQVEHLAADDLAGERAQRGRAARLGDTACTIGWARRGSRDSEFEFVVEGKIDGLAISLIYRDGKLERGVTRGNGMIGEDVTANLLTMKEVPRELPTKKPPALFEARGEVYIKRSDFHELNEAAGRGWRGDLRESARTRLRARSGRSMLS